MNGIKLMDPVEIASGSVYLSLRECEHPAPCETPVVVNGLMGYVLFAWRGRFYALPESLRFLKLDELAPEDLRELPSGNSLRGLLEQLHDLITPNSQEALNTLVDELREKLSPDTAASLIFLIRNLSRDPVEKLILMDSLTDATELGTLTARLQQTQLAKIQSLLDPDKKTVAIYFPSKAYRENAGTLAKSLRDRGCNAFTLVGVVCGDRYEEGDQVFYGGHNFIADMTFVDVFVVPTLMYGLPSQAKKVLLVHDIYDSPVGDRLEFFRLLCGFDYFILPSRYVVDLFREIVETPFELAKKEKPLTLVPGGYVKLDRLIQYFQEHQRDEKVIVYAPTVTGLEFEDVISLPKHGAAIIEKVLEEFLGFTLIFRPHPHSVNTEVVKEIQARFASHPRFVFDDNASFYMENYSRSAVMISDISGTAYTYSFATLRPVVFFSHNEEGVQKKYQGLKYVHDRKKVGAIATTVDELPTRIREVLENRDAIKARVREYRDTVIFHIGKAEEYLAESIGLILEGKSAPEWTNL